VAESPVPDDPAPSPSLLDVQGLEKSFSGRPVVRGIDLRVSSGEVVGLLGPNGAGKTTSFRMIAGLLRPDRGTIRFAPRGEAQDLAGHTLYQRAQLGMGYLPQESSVFRALTVEANLLSVLEMLGLSRQERASEAARLIEDYGLGEVTRSRADTLSGGERRRLEIARALVMKPRLLLLDEPFSGIDPIAVADLRGLLERLAADGLGVLLTDHSVHDTLRATDRAYVIAEGRLVAEGTPAALVKDPLARQYYLGEDPLGANLAPAPEQEPGEPPD
jgi:lipopolysaccharide export system ATP-binding protein